MPFLACYAFLSILVSILAHKGCHPNLQRWNFIVSILAGMLCCLNAFADDGTDLLQGTDASAWATLTGTGKKYIYMIEFVLAVASYMTTRKLIVFTGFVVISVVVNMVLHFAGQSG